MNDAHDNDATDKEIHDNLMSQYLERSVENAHRARDAGYPHWRGLLPRGIQQTQVGHPTPGHLAEDCHIPNCVWHPEGGGVVNAETIHDDLDIQHMDIRIYFGQDMDPEDVRDTISRVLQDSGDMCFMISAYELVPFTKGAMVLIPSDKPLA